MRKIKESRRGQITIEGAISFSITLVFIASVISSVQFYRTDILMRRSVEQTCEKMSLLYPASVPATDALSAALNAFPDLGLSDSKGAEIIGKVVSVATGFDNASGKNMEELILEGMFSKTMEDQIRKAYIERNGGSDFFVPDDIEVLFNINEDHHIIEVTTRYSVVTIAGEKSRCIYSVIPLYGDPVLTLQAEETSKPEAKKDDIWSLNNFDRGDKFREMYGANLPKTFPVADAYENGKVTCISSIDITSPYYQDISHIEKKVKDDINELSSFEPQSARINGSTYSVDYINSRYLTVIIPENSGEAGRAAIEELKGYALIHGVILNVSEYGTSERYSSGT